MTQPSDFQEFSCKQCLEASVLDFDFSMAFQPIVDIRNGKVFGYEALVRGVNNESAASVLAQVNESNRYRFDQKCRVKAIALASELNLQSILSINFLPNAVYRPELCIRTTLEAAKTYRFPIENILFEFTEGEKIQDSSHVKNIVTHYQSVGFKTATDDFGSGYSGLNLLADFQTDIIKFDMDLIRNIHQDPVRQAIIQHSVNLCDALNIQTLAEGIECQEELAALQKMGVQLIQGYYFAKPGFEHLPEVDLSLIP
ncbi:MAG: EAL domain-containing protein [Gammaproteobacteria bacterium]|nr:EAL domain-containing protein [Gammaproteobacteria bacterium]